MNKSTPDEVAEPGNREGTYGLHDRAFEPLPENDPAVRRRKEVKQFSGEVRGDQRPRWNASTVDEAHPFPERAQFHTTANYRGVDVVATHFPETVKNSSLLRGNSKPPMWDTNQANAQSTHRYTYNAEALKDKEPPPSYLEKVIMEEYMEDKKAKRQGWQTSTALEGHQANKFAAEHDDVNYVELNKTKLGIMNEANYTPPVQRVKELNETVRTQKQNKRDAQEETDVTLFQTVPGAPTTFTMRNKDQWIQMDPVEVARSQVEKKEELKANPYTQYNKYATSK